jgi:hypothetical protein
MGHVRTRKFARLALLPLVTFAVAGCATKFTGGGTINSTDGTDQASFSFNYKVTDTSTGSGKAQGAYDDSYAPAYTSGGVEFKFDGLLSSATGPYSECVTDGVLGTASYTSQNPNYPGGGTVDVEACDNGKPSSVTSDWISVHVTSGPYSGYSDSGDLTGGNLQAHK